MFYRTAPAHLFPLLLLNNLNTHSIMITFHFWKTCTRDLCMMSALYNFIKAKKVFLPFFKFPFLKDLVISWIGFTFCLGIIACH